MDADAPSGAGGLGDRGPGPRISLRVRLTAWVVAIYSLIQWTTCGVLLLYQSVAIDHMSDARLLERAEDLTGLVAAMVPGIGRGQLDEIARRQSQFMRSDSLWIEVLRKDGTPLIAGEPGVIDPGAVPVGRVLAGGEEIFFPLRVDGPAGPRRAVSMTILGADLEPYVLVVASSNGSGRAQFLLVMWVIMISVVLGTVAAAVSGWFIAGIAVAPFGRLRRMAKEFGPETLDRSLRFDTVNTEVAELTNQLEDTRRRIRDAFAAQDRFLSNIAHEIKTPIAVISVEADTLDMSQVPQRVSDFVASTREEMGRLGMLVESFLTLARLQEGNESGRRRLYAANDLVMDAIEHNAAFARQIGVRLTLDLLAEDGLLHTAVSGDPDLLRTMLDNLIRNAVRFTGAGGMVAVRVSVAGDTVEIRVVDQGPGIPSTEIASVFERFVRASNQAGNEDTQTGGGGHGLGLAIARGIADLYGGSITATNLEEGGCEFCVRLPRAADEETAAEG